MHRYQPEEPGIMKNRVHMATPKEINKAPITDLKETEIYELSIQNNPLKEVEWTARKHRQLMKWGKQLHEQNEKFDKEMAAIKNKNKKQNIKPKQKNPRIEKHNNWRIQERVSKVDHVEERIRDLVARTLEITPIIAE